MGKWQLPQPGHHVIYPLFVVAQAGWRRDDLQVIDNDHHPVDFVVVIVAGGGQAGQARSVPR